MQCSYLCVVVYYGQRSICRKIVVYVVYSSTSRAIAHALSNDLNDTFWTGILNAARCLGSYTM